MRIGLNVRIDVKKIEKARLYQGEKGTYLDLTTFIDTEQKDQYGNNGFISQSTSKAERDQGVQTTILGNVRVFHKDSSSDGGQQQPSSTNDSSTNNSSGDDYDDDIPF